MASALQNSAPSIFPLSPALPTQLVGGQNPIALPLIQMADIARTIGERIGQGGYSDIHLVSHSQPQRVYNIIPLHQFANGDQIRIAKIASDTRVSPTFYGACLAQKGKDKFVIMEMDHAGKSLLRSMKDLDADVKTAAPIADSSPQMARLRALQKLADKVDDGSGFKVHVFRDEAIDQIYKSREDFFFELFTAIRVLAENNIAYMDSNCDNLFPSAGNGLKLLDFDSASAKLVGSCTEAAAESMKSLYNVGYMRDFSALPNLSPKSRELIGWFKAQEMEQIMKFMRPPSQVVHSAGIKV
jgi:hypothetical protein